MDETNNISSGATAATSEPSQPSAPTPQFDHHGVNPAWVKEMTQPLAEAPHETDRGPDSGRTTQTIPANDVPHPDRIGQYDRENILSYHPQSGDQQSYDFNGALQSVMSDPRPEAFAQFVQGIPDEHMPGFQDLARNYIAHDPENVIRELIAMDHLPGWILPPAQGTVDPDDPALAGLSPELRSFVIGEYDPADWEEVAPMAPEARERILQRDMELAQMKQQQHEQAVETGAREWQQSVNDFGFQYGLGWHDYLAQNFHPFTEDAANAEAREDVLMKTAGQALSDPQMKNGEQAILHHLAEAADARFNGDERLAKAREAEAHKLARRLDSQFRALLQKNVERYNRQFQHAPGARETLAQDIERAAAREAASAAAAKRKEAEDAKRAAEARKEAEMRKFGSYEMQQLRLNAALLRSRGGS